MEYALADILNGCKQETAAWQKILYEKYYGYAFSVCLRYSSNSDEAMEIMNDGFVKIFRGIIKFVPHEDESILQKSFMSWIKTIMINTGINYSKSSLKKIAWSKNNDEIAEDEISTQHEAVENLMYEDLVKLVHKLSPAYRNTFSLYAIEGYGHEDISRMLGISVGTSKSNLLKARRNLRKMLEDVYGERIS